MRVTVSGICSLVRNAAPSLYSSVLRADGHEWPFRVNLSHWMLDLGNFAPTAGLERDVGQQAARRGRRQVGIACDLAAIPGSREVTG
jgi:hypothetical protein